MTIRENCEWLYLGTDTIVSAVQNSEGIIILTCVAGADWDTSIGDTWTWSNTEEKFLEYYAFARESEKNPIPSIWISVVRWADGTTSFDLSEPHTSREAAIEDYENDPFDDETGEPCELLDVVEVVWRG